MPDNGPIERLRARGLVLLDQLERRRGPGITDEERRMLRGARDEIESSDAASRA